MSIAAFAITFVDGFPNVCESNVGGWAGTGLVALSGSGGTLGEPGGVVVDRARTGEVGSETLSDSGGTLGEPGGVVVGRA